ncbi:MAG: phage tail protein [Methylobacter sp.]
MSDYFLGEIRMFSFSWAPQNWALCQGQQLGVQQNQALFALLGNTYGGNLQTVFNLPDLRGRVPLCFGVSPISGTTYQQGVSYAGGTEGVTLTAAQVPIHTHTVKAMSAKGSAGPVDGIISSLNTTVTPSVFGTYAAGTALQPLNNGTVSTVGGAAHSNMQPFTVANFCIATVGIFPSRN